MLLVGLDAEERNPINGSAKKVLVVDSEPKVCELISLVLKECDFQVVISQSFDEFEELVSSEIPHLVIIDPSLFVGQCRLNFYKTFFREISLGKIKFLLLGPPECKKDFEELKVEGAVNYCIKPFSTKGLKIEIYKLVCDGGETNG